MPERYRARRRGHRTAPFSLLSAVLAVVLVTVSPAAGAAQPGGAAEDGHPNSADRMIVWTACHHVALMTNAELDRWHRRGVDGFVCNVQRLSGMGGRNSFTGDPGELDGEGQVLERTLRESHIAGRAAKRGMKLYLGFYLTNALNPATPLAEWFDDAAWTTTVLPAVRGIATAARSLGFEGLAFDQELYQQQGGRRTATWEWDYPGNTRTEDEVRREARERGRQMMRTIVDAFPNVDILAYYTKFPETFDALVQTEVNNTERPYEESLQIDFWDGLSSVEGYRSIGFLNATFYKIPHLGTWDSVYTYQYNRLFALLSRRLSNWDYAAGRVYESPFVWISSGSTSFEEARSPEHVEEQLMAARKWGMERQFANYGYGGLEEFDYGPYESAMRAASRPGVVDDERPTLLVGEPSISKDRSVDLAGSAGDNLAIRTVRWETDEGTSGVAEMTWVPGVGNPLAGPQWEMEWSARGIPVRSGAQSVTVTVEDIKGLSRSKTVTVRG